MRGKIKSVVLFFDPKKIESAQWAKSIEGVLNSKNVSVSRLSSREEVARIGRVDAAVALGGDGTVLHAARQLAGKDISLLGVNSGNLGFLSGVDAAEFERRVDEFLERGFKVAERWLISAVVLRRGKKVFGPAVALNDCVIKTAEPRAFHIRTSLEGKFLAEYFGDGIIVSTPTGSTAYALAASGPIISPELDVMLITPICPHTLTQRPVVLSANKSLAVVPMTRTGEAGVRAVISLDGQVNFDLRAGDELTVTKYSKPVKLLLPSDLRYFDVLRRKLKWGGR